jgi:thioesterase domain-containing protein
MSDCLIPLQPRGSRPPLFCAHPAGGSVFCYLDLARHLDANQPLYGLQAIELNKQARLDAHIPTMAARYVCQLRHRQPTGPYYVSGWSLGGVVAFEMARQLRAQGQQIGLLALFDCAPPAPQAQEATEDQLIYNFARSIGLTPAQIDAALGQDPRPERDLRLAAILEQSRLLGIVPASLNVEDMHHLLKVFTAHVRALRNYAPQHSSERISLFCAGEADEAVTHGMLRGWRALTSGDVDMHVLPGDHFTMLKPPHVQDLATALQRTLDSIHAPT